jgi:hypothetical protein
MIYGITTEATDFTDKLLSDWRVRLIKTILFFLPRANPDNERFYPRVKSWALELDESGWPQREIGLDASGTPLFGAPDARNTGFWPDMARRKFAATELQPMTQEILDALWRRIVVQHASQHTEVSDE